MIKPRTSAAEHEAISRYEGSFAGCSHGIR